MSGVTLVAPGAVGAFWASPAFGTPQSGHGSGRGRVGMLAKKSLHSAESEHGRAGVGSGCSQKIHFTLQKVNTDDLHNALMLCEVNVEVTSQCVK
jgi:hypothetical protein